MKIRNGFVSNSSSSSFVCQICNAGFAWGNGEDITYKEDMIAECKNNHKFCLQHLSKDYFESQNEDFTGDFKIKALKLYIEKEFISDIPNLETKTGKEIDEMFEDLIVDSNDLYYEFPPEFCPVCQIEAMSYKNILLYLLKKSNATKEKIVKKIHDEFSGNYKEFEKFLKGKNK